MGKRNKRKKAKRPIELHVGDAIAIEFVGGIAAKALITEFELTPAPTTEIPYRFDLLITASVLGAIDFKG